MARDPIEMRLRRRLAENIRVERARLDWSQERLADEAGFSSAKAISRIETCEIEPGFTKLVRIAWAFGVEPARLLAGMERRGR